MEQRSLTENSVEQRAFTEIQQLLSKTYHKVDEYYNIYRQELRNKIAILNVQKKNELISQIAEMQLETEIPKCPSPIVLQECQIYHSDYHLSDLVPFENDILAGIPNTIKSFVNEIKDMENKLKSIHNMDMDIYKENYFVNEKVVEHALQFIEEFKIGPDDIANHEIDVSQCKIAKSEAIDLLNLHNMKKDCVNILQSEISKLEKEMIPLVKSENSLCDSAYSYIREHELHHLLINDNGDLLLELDENRLLLEQPLQDCLQILDLNPFSSKDELLEAMEYHPDAAFDVRIEDSFSNYSEYVEDATKYNADVLAQTERQSVTKNLIKQNIKSLENEVKDILRLEMELDTMSKGFTKLYLRQFLIPYL